MTDVPPPHGQQPGPPVPPPGYPPQGYAQPGYPQQGQPQWGQPQQGYPQPAYPQPGQAQWGQPQQSQSSWGGAPEGPPPAEGAPPAAGDPKRRRRVLVALGVVVAVLAAGGIAVAVTRGLGGASGGADSPEQAVRDASSAVTKQDLGGLLATMNPDEVRTLGSLLDAARQKAAASGVVQAKGVLEPWLSLSVTGLTTSVDRPRSDVALVTLTGGTASATVDETTMPDAIRPADPQVRRGSGDLASRAETGSDAFATLRTVVVVQRSGKWFISPTTTLMEGFRRQQELPRPDFANPAVLGNGAGSPQEAVQGLVTAVQARDFQTAAGFLSSKDLPGLAWYYPAFEQQLRDSFGDQPGTLSNLDTAVTSMSNGLRKVTVRAVSGRSEDGSFTYRAGCVTTDSSSKPACIDDDFTRLSKLSTPFVVTEQVDGRWRVSVVATVLEYLRIAVLQGDPDAAYLVLGVPQLSAVAATVDSGRTAPVTLNQAGYAHVVVTAPAGSCAPVQVSGGRLASTGRGFCEPDAGDDGVRIGSGGKTDVVVVNRDGPRPGTVQVTVGR